MSGEELRESAKTWWLDRAREPSTYQGLALLAPELPAVARPAAPAVSK